MDKAKEDYIKIIYSIIVNSQEDLVKIADIASELDYSDQSVIEMIKKLEKLKLVKYIPYQGVSLTNRGEQEAIRVVRNHRIWEVFLMEKLGFSWQVVHEEAEKLEHVSSDELINRLYDYLGKPTHCAHGNLIPSNEHKIVRLSEVSLDTISENDSFIVLRVVEQKEVLRFLDEINLKINGKIKVTYKDDFNGFMKISYQNKEVFITTLVAKKIFGHKLL